MEKDICEIDGKLAEALHRLHKEKNYPRDLGDLEQFPYESFGEVQIAIQNKELVVQANPLKTASVVFSLMATKNEARKKGLALLLTASGILVYPIAAVLFSNYWLLLAVPIQFVGSGFLSSPYLLTKIGRLVLLIILAIAFYLSYVSSISWGPPIVVGLFLGVFGSSLARNTYWKIVRNRASQLENALVLLLWGDLVWLMDENSNHVWRPPFSSDLE